MADSPAPLSMASWVTNAVDRNQDGRTRLHELSNLASLVFKGDIVRRGVLKKCVDEYIEARERGPLSILDVRHKEGPILGDEALENFFFSLPEDLRTDIIRNKGLLNELYLTAASIVATVQHLDAEVDKKRGGSIPFSELKTALAERVTDLLVSGLKEAGKNPDSEALLERVKAIVVDQKLGNSPMAEVQLRVGGALFAVAVPSNILIDVALLIFEQAAYAKDLTKLNKALLKKLYTLYPQLERGAELSLPDNLA